jgi:hypothetical protein
MDSFAVIGKELGRAWKRVGKDYKKDRIYSEQDMVSSFYYHSREWVDTQKGLRLFTEFRISLDRSQSKENKKFDVALVEIEANNAKLLFHSFVLLLEFKFYQDYDRNYVKNKIKEDLERMREIVKRKWYFWNSEVPKPQTWGLFVIDDHVQRQDILFDNGLYNSEVENGVWNSINYIEGHAEIEIPQGEWRVIWK